jgi:phage terminase small subunit
MGSGEKSKISVTSAHPLHTLDGRERQFATFVAEGKSVRTAAALAGYNDANGRNRDRLKNDPRVVKAVEFLRKKSEQSILTSRKKVLEGFLEAIEQAKMMSEPMTQIAGWREIGKLCGYYAPEVKQLNVTVGAKRVVSQLEVMSDQALLELIEKDSEVIEGEAIEVLSVPAYDSEAGSEAGSEADSEADSEPEQRDS